MATETETPKKGPEEPAPASTIVLMRQKEDDLEIFFVKRHGKARFMANRFVFPGGRMDEEDKETSIGLHCRGYVPQELAERMGVEEEEAVGLHVAGFRELFEEAGALLATESNGDPIDFTSPDELDRYDTYRVTLQEEEVSFNQIIEWEDLTLRMDELLYFAHWITPNVEKHRYDTRFFLARAPAHQTLVHDEVETTDSCWMTPQEAVDGYAAGDLQLAPPTLHILLNLAAYQTVDEVLDHYRGREVPPVEPQPTFEGGTITLLLPGDPEYKGDEASVEGPTRIAMQDGKWIALVPDK